MQVFPIPSWPLLSPLERKLGLRIRSGAQNLPASDRGETEMRSGGTQFDRAPAAPSVPAQLLTLDDVAKIMKVSRAWVRDHCTRRHPKIPVVRFGGRRAVLRFRPEDVADL